MTKPKSTTRKAAKAGRTAKTDEAKLAKLVESGEVKITPAAEGAAKKPAKKVAEPKVKAPKEDLVVFAFRLTSDERDAIHRAAGPAGASRFVRMLAVAAAKKDGEGLQKILDAVGAAR